MIEVDRLARMPNTVVISCEMDLNLDTLKSRIWEGLGLNRVYTKRRGVKPDLSDPLIVKRDASIEQVVRPISSSFFSSLLFPLCEDQLTPTYFLWFST